MITCKHANTIMQSELLWHWFMYILIHYYIKLINLHPVQSRILSAQVLGQLCPCPPPPLRKTHRYFAFLQHDFSQKFLEARFINPTNLQKKKLIYDSQPPWYVLTAAVCLFVSVVPTLIFYLPTEATSKIDVLNNLITWKLQAVTFGCQNLERLNYQGSRC